MLTPPEAIPILWLAKGAAGDGFAIASGFEHFHHWLGDVSLTVAAGGACQPVLAQHPLVKTLFPLPHKAAWPAWVGLEKKLRLVTPRLVVLTGKGRAMTWAARRLGRHTGAPVVDYGGRAIWLPSGERLGLERLPADIPEHLDKLGFVTHPLPFPLPPMAWKDITPTPQAERKGVLVAPFASQRWPSKEWPLAQVAELVGLLQTAGLEVTLLAGKADEPRLLPLLNTLPGVAVAVGEDFAALGQRLGAARVCVSGESMPAHAAPLFGAVAVVWLGPTTRRFVPHHPGAPAPVLLHHPALDCLGCHQPHCPKNGEGFHRCLRELSPATVAEAVTLAHHNWPPPLQPPWE